MGIERTAGLKQRRWLVRTVVIALASVGLGCATYGNVRIGTPQVYTREHLVGQRVREHQWVDNQLIAAEAINPTYAGLRDVSVAVGFANNLKLSLTPKPGGAAKGGDAAAPAADADAAGDAEKPAAAGKDEKGEEHGAAEPPLVPDVLKRGSEAAETKAEFDALQIFEYRAAVRNRINAALRETELDDTHDLLGATLYTLQFPVTVVPGSSTSDFAGVELEVSDPPEAAIECNYQDPDAGVRQRDYEAWLRALQRQIQDEQFAEQEALRGRVSVRREAKVRSCEGIATQAELEKDCGHARDLGCLAAACVARKYRQRLLFHGQDPKTDLPRTLEPAVIDAPVKYDRGDYASTIRGTPERRDDFWLRLWFLGWCWRYRTPENPPVSKDPEPVIRVVGIEPKEYSQNISEVAASETLLRLSASIHALIPNSGGSVENDTDYARKSQALLQSITNQPLVVGYSDSRSMFGWLLGPPFAISGTTAVFRQRPVTRIVTVDLSVPAWWPSVKLTGSAFWLDRYGHRSHRERLWGNEGLAVALPGDLRALSTTLMGTRVSERPQPSIQYAEPNFPCPETRDGKVERQCVYFRATGPAKATTPDQVVYIRGRELWRSPQVFLGAQKADEVEVLSDMGGVVAHFKHVDMPGSGRALRTRINLSVVTSVGEATLYKKAIIEQP